MSSCASCLRSTDYMPCEPDISTTTMSASTCSRQKSRHVGIESLSPDKMLKDGTLGASTYRFTRKRRKELLLDSYYNDDHSLVK